MDVETSDPLSIKQEPVGVMSQCSHGLFLIHNHCTLSEITNLFFTVHEQRDLDSVSSVRSSVKTKPDRRIFRYLKNEIVSCVFLLVSLYWTQDNETNLGTEIVLEESTNLQVLHWPISQVRVWRQHLRRNHIKYIIKHHFMCTLLTWFTVYHASHWRDWEAFEGHAKPTCFQTI